jgi:hypothetical protein
MGTCTSQFNAFRIARNDGDTYQPIRVNWNSTSPAATRMQFARARENFFSIFVDRMFTTFIERPFTNAFDAIRETLAMSCV